MDEDESFDEFYVKLKDIVNFAFILREQILEPQDCQEDPQFSSKKISCQDHYHRRIKGSCLYSFGRADWKLANL